MKRWDIRGSWLYATADVAAGSDYFYNSWYRKMEQFDPAAAAQESDLGMEFDLGVTYHWDEAFRFDFDMGLFLPGGFYKFSNTATENQTGPVFAGVARVGLDF